MVRELKKVLLREYLTQKIKSSDIENFIFYRLNKNLQNLNHEKNILLN